MQDIIGSVRRSLVFRTTPEDNEGTGFGAGSGTLVDKINSCIRKSRVFTRPLPAPSSRPIIKEGGPTIRWRKGEMIGCGAFGQVYMGMNLDSGELLAVKQVLIASNGASKEKAQTHIKELEEEVKLLKDLSHPNIVRYLGTAREENTLNILLEFVPGGSISSLLGKFGSFPEAVVRTYTKQLLLGLEYLHRNGIMHRDIKGANILVDNKGCIKLADFGASKQVVELATISGAKSMKGTPYWMAPEVILQTGHSFSADIWSVGCTVIEMATGKPPWSQQYQEVAALFHIGTTKSPPPIPEHLSFGAKDFLVKCLQKEPNARPTASELLQHPFVTGEQTGTTTISRNSALARSGCQSLFGSNEDTYKIWTASDSMDVCNLGSLDCSTVCKERLSGNQQCWGMNGDDDDDDMCKLDDEDDFKMVEMKPISTPMSDNFKSFNPMCEPSDNWECNSGDSLKCAQQGLNTHVGQVLVQNGNSGVTDDDQKEFSFPYGPSLCEDDDEVTESKIQAFLDEKALELKKMQTPLYEEFYNSMIGSCSADLLDTSRDEAALKYLKLPPKSPSPSRGQVCTSSKAVDNVNAGSPRSNSIRQSNIGNPCDHSRQDASSSPTNDWKGLVADSKLEQSSPSVSFAERQRKWKEELDQELQRQREMMRQAGVGGKTSSPKHHHKQRERTRFASPGK